MAVKLQEIIPVAFKTYKRTPISFKSGEFIIFLGQNPTFNCRMRTSWKLVAILNFQIANQTILIRNTNWTCPEKFILVS